MFMKWCRKLDVAWERFSIVFQGHPPNFKVTRLKNRWFWPNFGVTTVCASFQSHRWIQSLKQHRRGVLLFFKIICQISRSDGTKNADFDPNWACPVCNTSLNSLMVMKLCTKLEAANRCPIVFQGHPWNFKVTRGKNFRFWPKLSVSVL